MKDDACPTCGSKKFEIQKSENSSNSDEIFLKCNNCKKSWYSQVPKS